MTKTFLQFAATFVALFVLAYAFLAMVDALPEPVQSEQTPQQSIENSSVQVAELPVRIVAKSIGMDNTVLNSDSTDVAELDSLLLKGVVRYPGAGMLGVNGTVLIFGHSSYLPIVHNQNYKAFNGIQKLKAGQEISVYSATTEYRYAVTEVRLADASEDVVELPTNGKYLTLVTCDSFGTKSDRYVVTAEFAGAYTL